MKTSIRQSRTALNILAVSLVVCFATTAPSAPKQVGLANPSRITWEVAPEISYIKYTEPGLMEDEGYMLGINASFIYHGPLSKIPKDANSWMLRGDAKFSWGEVDYDGALMDGTPYKIHDIEDTMLEFRGLLGYDFRNKIARTTPYSGFAYRYLRDDSSFDSAGYERESNYLYVPVGFEIAFASVSEWSFGMTIEADILVWGKQRSHLGGSYGTIENRQDEGEGFRASLRFQKTQPGVDFGIEPFVRYWNIDWSQGSDGFIEPKNRSTEIGLRLVWAF
jgi:hypothetical protein